MTKKHAKLSPSAAYIWMTCPGQPGLVEKLGKKIVRTSSVYAEEGTAAHALGEHCLQNGFNADRFLGWSVHPDGRRGKSDDGEPPAGWFLVGEDMAGAVNTYLKAVRAEIAPGDEWETEVRLEVSDNLWGTGDLVRYRPSTQALLVADYKHGAGVPVDLIGNPQILIYAVGAAKRLGNRGLKTVRLGIIQPRCPTVDPVRWWDIDAADLMEFWADLNVAVSSTRCDGAKLLAGEHCRWCPAAPFCPTLAEASANSGPVPDTGEELAAALSRIPAMEAWIKAIQDEALAVANRGGTVPGWKLVEKEGNRAWADEAEAKRTLLGLGYGEADILDPATLKTVAATERVIGKKEFADHLAGYVHRPKGGVKLVPNSHKAPAINRDIRADFEPVVPEPAPQPQPKAAVGIFD